MTDRVCKYEGCTGIYHSKGLCRTHHSRLNLGKIVDSPVRKRRAAGATCERNALGQKWCIACEAWLDEPAFNGCNKTLDGYEVSCRACKMLASKTWRYKLSGKEISERLATQHNKCAICPNDITNRFIIDHNHKCCPGYKTCGRCVRKLLCDGCNIGLGAFNDSLELLMKAYLYVEEHELEIVHENI